MKFKSTHTRGLTRYTRRMGEVVRRKRNFVVGFGKEDFFDAFPHPFCLAPKSPRPERGSNRIRN